MRWLGIPPLAQIDVELRSKDMPNAIWQIWLGQHEVVVVALQEHFSSMIAGRRMGSSFAQCNGNGNDRPIANVDIQETTSNILVLANSARLR